ncbi:hypothetical protein Tco_0383289 [Tanacetum coccineum]
MSTYLKNMAGYKHNQLKTKSFEEIQMLFDKAMTRVNTFVDMDTELVKGNETRTEESSKRTGEELESKNLKKQKLDENVEAEVDDDQEEAEMKKHMEIVPDDEGRIIGIKRLHDDLGVNTAKVRVIAAKIIMVNVIPPDRVDDVPVVELNQHDDVPIVPEPDLVDEDEDPEEDEFEEEEDPQEEEDDMEVDIKEDEFRSQSDKIFLAC